MRKQSIPGRFSTLMWPGYEATLPRLHHHDILTIVEYIDYCGVILHIDYCEVITPCHDKVLLSHFKHRKFISFFSMQVLYRVGVGLLLTFELIVCVYSQGMS